MLDILLGSVGLLVLIVLVMMFRYQSLLGLQRKSHQNKGGATNKVNAALFVIFLIVGIGYSLWYTFAKADEYMLPDPSSEHGWVTDGLFMTTMVILAIVVIVTHFLLFGFAYKYQYKEGRKAKYYPDNHILELAWTVVPALVLTFLVFQGWKAWSNITSDPKGKPFEVEVVAQQFGWEFRYPGADGKFGKHDFRKIDPKSGNTLGIDYSDPDNIAALDDFTAPKLFLPKGREVLVRLRSKDVIHSFYLPHFRVKMDCVPGMPTRFKFTPTVSTEEMKANLSAIPRYQRYYKGDTNNRYAWEQFDYELVCAEICGRGHFGMKGTVIVLEGNDFDNWFSRQTPWSVGSEEQLKFVKSEIASSMKPGAIKSFNTKLNELTAINGPMPETDTTGLVDDTLFTKGIPSSDSLQVNGVVVPNLIDDTVDVAEPHREE